MTRKLAPSGKGNSRVAALREGSPGAMASSAFATRGAARGAGVALWAGVAVAFVAAGVASSPRGARQPPRPDARRRIVKRRTPTRVTRRPVGEPHLIFLAEAVTLHEGSVTAPSGPSVQNGFH